MVGFVRLGVIRMLPFTIPCQALPASLIQHAQEQFKCDEFQSRAIGGKMAVRSTAAYLLFTANL